MFAGAKKTPNRRWLPRQILGRKSPHGRNGKGGISWILVPSLGHPEHRTLRQMLTIFGRPGAGAHRKTLVQLEGILRYSLRAWPVGPRADIVDN